MTRVAVYCRVSTQDQNLQQQIDKLSEYCGQRNWLYTIYTEKESSRGTRPIKASILSALRRYEYNGIVVWKLDRWGRSLRELVTDMEELQGRSQFFVSYSDNVDLSTPAGRLQFQMLAAFAQFERDLISERTKFALQNKKQRGEILGRPKGSKDRKSRVRKYFKKPQQ